MARDIMTASGWGWQRLHKHVATLVATKLEQSLARYSAARPTSVFLAEDSNRGAAADTEVATCLIASQNPLRNIYAKKY